MGLRVWAGGEIFSKKINKKLWAHKLRLSCIKYLTLFSADLEEDDRKSFYLNMHTTSGTIINIEFQGWNYFFLVFVYFGTDPLSGGLGTYVPSIVNLC